MWSKEQNIGQGGADLRPMRISQCSHQIQQMKIVTGKVVNSMFGGGWPYTSGWFIYLLSALTYNPMYTPTQEEPSCCFPLLIGWFIGDASLLTFSWFIHSKMTAELIFPLWIAAQRASFKKEELIISIFMIDYPLETTNPHKNCSLVVFDVFRHTTLPHQNE